MDAYGKMTGRINMISARTEERSKVKMGFTQTLTSRSPTGSPSDSAPGRIVTIEMIDANYPKDETLNKRLGTKSDSTKEEVPDKLTGTKPQIHQLRGGHLGWEDGLEQVHQRRQELMEYEERARS